jgi:two-component SAPR family response regulator
MIFLPTSGIINIRINAMNAPDSLTTQTHALIITRDDTLSLDLEKKLAGIKAFESIDIVNDCLDGIAFVQKHHPDLIIFDTEVSVLEVLNALRTVKSLSHGIQCVVIADHIGYHALLSMVGADKILYKGFSQTELACCLN